MEDMHFRLTIAEKPVRLIITGGLIAISIVILQAFISVGRLDTSATISVYALALALPMLAGNTVITTFSSNSDSPRALIVLAIGVIAAVIGIAAALYHVSWIACLLFVCSGIVCGFLSPPLGVIEDISKH